VAPAPPPAGPAGEDPVVPVTTPQTLPRTARIRRRAEFERVYNTGLRLHGRYMTVFLVPNGTPSPRLGVAATRKLGPATHRSRAKRLAREVFRRHKIAVGLDVVIVPRREMLDAVFTNLEADYLAILEKRHRSDAGRPVASGHRRRARSSPRL
jgi:ribonuclease P protein component